MTGISAVASVKYSNRLKARGPSPVPGLGSCVAARKRLCEPARTGRPPGALSRTRRQPILPAGLQALPPPQARRVLCPGRRKRGCHPSPEPLLGPQSHSPSQDAPGCPRDGPGRGAASAGHRDPIVHGGPTRQGCVCATFHPKNTFRRPGRVARQGRTLPCHGRTRGSCFAQRERN